MSETRGSSVDDIYDQLRNEIEAAKAENRKKRQLALKKRTWPPQSLPKKPVQQESETPPSSSVSEPGQENERSDAKAGPPGYSGINDKSRDSSRAGFAPQPNPYASLKPVKRKMSEAKAPPRPFAPPKKAARGPSKETYTNIRTVETRTTTNPADWYDRVNMKEAFSRSDMEAVKQIMTLVKKLEKVPLRSDVMEPIFSEIRKRIHQMEFYDFLSGIIVKKSKILEDNGLRVMFEERTPNVKYPWDLQEDARALFLRWSVGTFDPHLLRGISTEQKNNGSGSKRTNHRLNTKYAGRKDCKVTGDNDLVNGQWWPLQICAMRDGAHGEIEAGICGTGDKGAFSVTLSSGGYDDKDEGDTIYYCGTSGSADKVSTGTRYLLKAFEEGSPIRVLRSAALPRTNPYRPAKGLRYDGLYIIKDFKILNAETSMHRFRLQRCAGQNPIRYRGVEKRPTEEELAKYSEIRGLLGLKS